MLMLMQSLISLSLVNLKVLVTEHQLGASGSFVARSASGLVNQEVSVTSRRQV